MAARSRTFLLIFAIASGLLAAALAVRYLRNQAQPILEGRVVTSGKALVAARDMPVGTVVTDKDMRLVDWPGDAVPQGMLGDPQAVIGRGILSPMRTNEPFLEAKLAPRGLGGGMPTLIEEGKRALSLQVDNVSGVSGFIVPGTRVDMLLTMPDPNDAQKQPTTRAILQNITALAAGTQIQQDPQGNPIPVPVLTVLVSPEQAETLTLASQQGRLQLALRHQLDTLEVETPGARASTLLYAEKKALGPAVVRRSAVRGPVGAPAQQETIVEGFEGGSRTVRRFTNTP